MSEELEIMTLKEAAAFLRIHRVTLYRWMEDEHRKDRPPGKRFGKTWRFSRTALMVWFNNQTLRSQSEEQ